MSLQLFYTDKVPSELKKLAVICHEGNNTQLTNDVLFSGLDATGTNKFEIWQTTSEVHDNSFKDFYREESKYWNYSFFNTSYCIFWDSRNYHLVNSNDVDSFFCCRSNKWTRSSQRL